MPNVQGCVLNPPSRRNQPNLMPQVGLHGLMDWIELKYYF